MLICLPLSKVKCVGEGSFFVHIVQLLCNIGDYIHFRVGGEVEEKIKSVLSAPACVQRLTENL